MGMKYNEVGGGPSVGLADDFVSFLQNGLNTGHFGTSQFNTADPTRDTLGVAGVLNDILSGGAGNIGGSINDMINRTVERNALALRGRYGVEGGAYGTGARTAETRLRAEATPQLTQAIGGLQLNALSQILPLIASFAGKGIAQREGAFSENPLVTGANVVGNLVRSAASIIPFTNPGSSNSGPSTIFHQGTQDNGNIGYPTIQTGTLPFATGYAGINPNLIASMAMGF